MKAILMRENFENALLLNGLSRSELARKCKLSEGYVYCMLRGKYNITPKSAKKIADALELPMTELFTFKE